MLRNFRMNEYRAARGSTNITIVAIARVIDNKMNKSRNRIDSVEFAYSTKVYYKSRGKRRKTQLH